MSGCAFSLHPNVHWLGDRKDIEGQTKVWDKVILDRQAELSGLADILAKVYKRKVPIYAYANNHYAGHGPATVEMFRGLLNARSIDVKPTGSIDALF